MKSARQTERDARDLWRLCVVDGVLDEGRARQVVDLTIASGRRGAPAILAGFVRLVKLARASRTAHVTSAAPLDKRTRAAIEEAIRRRYGPGSATIFEVDPRLIGGTRIGVGSDVYDGTVKARLAALEARF